MNQVAKNPFEKGVWLLIFMGGCDIVALVDEDNQTKEDLIKELIQSKCVCVTLKRRYVLKQLQFPIPEMDSRGKHTGNWQTGAVATVAKHEIALELMYEFPVYACLNNIAFVSDLNPDDIERLRKTINAADAQAEMMIRATKANILVPNNTNRL